MVCSDKVKDNLGKLMFLGDINTFDDMGDDDLCTLLWREFIMWIFLCFLILNEKLRIGQFTNVMVQGAGTDQ
ncbi:hypothetical protein D3C85_1835460 [compost metagenome]